MSEFSITSPDFEEGGDIPKKFGYKFENIQPQISFNNVPDTHKSTALIMDDPDAMAAVGKVWVHWLFFTRFTVSSNNGVNYGSKVPGKTDFGQIGYGGPAPPDKRHTYVFKAYALDTVMDLKEGYSKQELEDAMEGHIIAEAKLTGTFAP